MINARSNARVFHDASGAMDDNAWRMLSTGKEIGMLMLDMYYDFGNMEWSTGIPVSMKNNKELRFYCL